MPLGRPFLAVTVAAALAAPALAPGGASASEVPDDAAPYEEASGKDGGPEDDEPRVVRKGSRRGTWRGAPFPGTVVVAYPGADRAVRDLSLPLVQKYGRAGRSSVGIGGGVYVGVLSSGYSEVYPGLTFSGRYHMADPAAVELRVGLFASPDLYRLRLEMPIHGSFVLNTPSLAPVGLVGLFGASLNVFTHDVDDGEVDRLSGAVAGPHVGIGVRFNLGRNATFEVDGRLVHYFTPTGSASGGAWPVAFTSSGTFSFWR